MKTTHKKRLLKLADFLYTLPRNRFDFSTWVGDDWDGKANLACGTTACALGWATTMPEFRRLGLMLKHDDWCSYVSMVDDVRDDIVSGPELAAARVFGLDADEYRYLFTPRDYADNPRGLPNTATAKMVARRIREFVRRQT